MTHPISQLNVEYTKCCLLPPLPHKSICTSGILTYLDNKLLKTEIMWESSLVSLFPSPPVLVIYFCITNYPIIW